MIKFVSGVIKSPTDKRDLLVTTFLKVVELPNNFDILNEMSPVRNQGNEGSCAGHAGDGVKEWEEKKDIGDFVLLSPRYIYELAKKISGHSEGTTLKAICEVLLKSGICYEKDWPYVAGNPGVPKLEAAINAKKYKIKGYARITTLPELKQAIYNGYPNGGAILCGLQLYKGAVGEQAQKTGATPDPSCFEKINGPIGGHALVACGWNDNSPYYKNDGHIIFKGSWGEGFGDKGYHYFSYKNVKANMIDAMVMVDIEGSENILTVATLPKKSREKFWV